MMVSEFDIVNIETPIARGKKLLIALADDPKRICTRECSWYPYQVVKQNGVDSFTNGMRVVSAKRFLAILI